MLLRIYGSWTVIPVYLKYIFKYGAADGSPKNQAAHITWTVRSKIAWRAGSCRVPCQPFHRRPSCTWRGAALT